MQKQGPLFCHPARLCVADASKIEGGAFYLDREPQVKHMGGGTALGVEDLHSRCWQQTWEIYKDALPEDTVISLQMLKVKFESRNAEAYCTQSFRHPNKHCAGCTRVLNARMDLNICLTIEHTTGATRGSQESLFGIESQNPKP